MNGHFFSNEMLISPVSKTLKTSWCFCQTAFLWAMIVFINTHWCIGLNVPQSVMSLPTSCSRYSASSLLGLDTTPLCLASALGSTFTIGLATMALASACLGMTLGSSLGAGFGEGAGLGCLLGSSLVFSALLGGLLASLGSTLFSGTGVSGALSAFTLGGLGSGVAALTGALELGRGASSSSGTMRLFLAGATGAAAGGTSGALASDSNFCSGLISRSEPCSTLLLWRLGLREGTPPVPSGGREAAAEEVDGVVGRLLGLLLGLLPPLLPPRLDLSSLQPPGPRSLGSSLPMMKGLGEGVRPGDEPGIRLTSSFMSGLSGGVGRGSSSASRGSCRMMSVFSLPSATSCRTLFFRYSGPVQHRASHFLILAK